MTFAIEKPTKAKLEDVRVLSQKNRQADENPGIQLPLSVKLSNHALASLNGALKEFLFTKNGVEKPVATRKKDNATAGLEGVDPISDLPDLSPIGSKIKAFNWNEEVTGVTLTIGFATQKLEITDGVARAFRIQPQEGGTIQLKFIVEAPDASEKVFAKLAKFKSREVEIQLVQPASAQVDVEDDDATKTKKLTPQEAWPFPKDQDKKTPAQSAADAFAANEGAGKNKPASQVPQPRQRRASANRPSLKSPVE
ncbi:hypothetical protein CDN99_06465 [Roseateles aquatilis]|uniref:Uncharacterized protein n=1 Tax=Roseateles aquatilis TaxID=431061 RepID=A0A246JH61_9BURK|nr:hypothetical protein [Roseateles aquatilis]OWQ91998.1 hypothetical protein CDN99_06465 [Roseateles aquatilis]